MMFTVEKHAVLASTNDRAKVLASEGKRNICVIADRQTGGRGRMGRSFFSPPGCGLYLSAVFSPNIRGEDSALLTTYAAVAVWECIRALTGVTPSVKWVNDIYLNGKKICGILAEGKIDYVTGLFEYAVLGIGINVKKTPFPEELACIASDLETETGVSVCREELTELLLQKLAGMEKAFETRDFMRIYRENCFVLGRDIEVFRGNERFLAHALDVTDRGELLIRVGDQTQILQSGECSLRSANR